MPDSDLTADVLILGAGPGGCTAALYAARGGLQTVLLSPTELGGMMAGAHVVANWPGQLEPLPGRVILARMREHALAAGARHILQAALGVDFTQEGRLTVYAGTEVHVAAAVIIATGAMAPSKRAPGEEELLGRGVCHCAACDGPLFRGEDLVVVGQDDQAVEEAMTLAGLARSVRLVCPTPKLGAAEDLCSALCARGNVELEQGLALEEIVGQEAVEGVVFRDREGRARRFEATGVFLYTRGSAPAADFLGGCLATDDRGFLVTDEMCQASLPGVFAVGDVRSKAVRQNVVAAAEGCIAALAAERLIRRRERVRADRG